MGRSKRNKRNRDRKSDTMFWPIALSSKESFSPVNLATTYRDIIVSGFFDHSAEIKKAIDDGRITRFIVVCEGGWSARAIKSFEEILAQHNCEWVSNHLVLARKTEDNNLDDIFACSSINFLATLNAALLTKYVKYAKITTLYLANKKLNGWPGLIRHIGSKLPSFHNYSGSFVIIDTAVVA